MTDSALCTYSRTASSHSLHAECRAGKHLIVFLEKGPFILVMASATGEPEVALMTQLALVHAQILSILTNSVEKMFARNPSYDARKLLGTSFHHVPKTDMSMSVCVSVCLSVCLSEAVQYDRLTVAQPAVCVNSYLKGSGDGRIPGFGGRICLVLQVSAWKWHLHTVCAARAECAEPATSQSS